MPAPGESQDEAAPAVPIPTPPAPLKARTKRGMSAVIHADMRSAKPKRPRKHVSAVGAVSFYREETEKAGPIAALHAELDEARDLYWRARDQDDSDDAIHSRFETYMNLVDRVNEADPGFYNGRLRSRMEGPAVPTGRIQFGMQREAHAF